jgi:hypothetical protein
MHAVAVMASLPHGLLLGLLAWRGRGGRKLPPIVNLGSVHTHIFGRADRKPNSIPLHHSHTDTDVAINYDFFA